MKSCRSFTRCAIFSEGLRNVVAGASAVDIRRGLDMGLKAANEALQASARLGKKGIPVRLVVLFDATVDIPVPLNVQEVLNLHKPSRFGLAVEGAPGYTGTIENTDVSDIDGIGHISIDKSKKLHAIVVAKVLSVFAESQSARAR